MRGQKAAAAVTAHSALLMALLHVCGQDTVHFVYVCVCASSSLCLLQWRQYTVDSYCQAIRQDDCNV